MLIKILLIVAIVIQTIATLFAIRLIRTTKYNSIWILFTIGFTLLSVERVVQFLRANGQTLPYEVFVWLGLVISISMSIGVMYAHKLFKYIARLNRQRQLLNKRILTAVLRTEEKSRSRFAKDLHDGLGPLLSSARMSLSALQRESLPADQQEIIGNTTYVIDEAIRSLREISNNLSPHVLNDFGLARGIQNFVGKSSAMHDVKIRFTTNLRSERYDTDVGTILNIALQITANTAIAIEPFMPFSAAKILKMLSVEKFGWEQLGTMDLIAAGHKIGEPVLLFEKIEDDVIQRQLDKLAATKEANAAAEAAQQVEPQKDAISFDDFQKMDIRVSTILAAEKVAKTKKLLKLTVDTGIDQREIVSGIAEYFTPEELVGRQVLVLVNLQPRELKGILSRGMILMAEDASGKLRLLSPNEATNSGAVVG